MKLTILGEAHTGPDGDFFPEEELKPIPPSMKEIHHIAMLNMYKMVVFLIQKKRELPLMMTELKSVGISKVVAKKLESLGLIQIRTAPLLSKTGEGALGLRNFVYWTPQGRAYVKEYIRHEQTGSNSGTTSDSGGVQPEVPTVDGEDRLHSELPVEVRAEGSEDNPDTIN